MDRKELKSMMDKKVLEQMNEMELLDFLKQYSTVFRAEYCCCNTERYFNIHFKMMVLDVLKEKYNKELTELS